MSQSKVNGLGITGGAGFHMQFANGWLVSVQFGVDNYCEHHHKYNIYDFDREMNTLKTEGIWQSADAEIAVWNNREGRNNDMTSWGCDTVVGHLNPNTIADVLHLVSKFSPDLSTEDAGLKLQELTAGPDCVDSEDCLIPEETDA